MKNNTKNWVTYKELEDEFEELLNDTNDLIKIGNLTYEAGHALKNIDSIAFRCGVNDYIDNLLSDNYLEEIDGEYYRVE
jgi:hypothetical protein